MVIKMYVKLEKVEVVKNPFWEETKILLFHFSNGRTGLIRDAGDCISEDYLYFTLKSLNAKIKVSENPDKVIEFLSEAGKSSARFFTSGKVLLYRYKKEIRESVDYLKFLEKPDEIILDPKIIERHDRW